MKSEVQKLPLEFLERLKRLIPTGKLDQIANTFAEEKPTTFRINHLKAESLREIKESLESQEFKLENVSWPPDAFILKSGRLRELQGTEEYKSGKIYVQNLSSMIPPLVLDPKAGETILDLAAAPGSKTTQIASLTRNQAKVIACDNNRVRYYKLKANLEMQGCPNVEALLTFGETIGRKYPDYFDKVLIDAPCSSEGRFDIREPSSFGYWKVQKCYEMAKKQKKLIFSAFSALKPGGILVYSTCTFAPEENEGVLNWLLRKFPGQVRVENITLPISNWLQGVSQWGKEAFDPTVRYGVRILPYQAMEGFFVARIRKAA